MADRLRLTWGSARGMCGGHIGEKLKETSMNWVTGRGLSKRQ